MPDPTTTAATEDRCVVCHLSDPRHGGLCCAHRYDEQPRCAECPPTTAAGWTNVWREGRYRKRAVVIEAVEWNGTNIKAVLGFCYADDRWKQGIESEYVGGPGIGHVPATGDLNIPTLEGTMTARPGDWIIRGVKGEMYPCKPDIFEATYEHVPDDAEDDHGN